MSADRGCMMAQIENPPAFNPIMTLASIRAKHPCKDGWKKLLAGLGYKGKYDPDRVVSLGDIATINDAADAMWCVRVLDWPDIAVRRAVIAGAVLPAIKRVSASTKDQRVHKCIAAIEKWCAGDDSVDLNAAYAAADAAYAAAYAAAYTATYAAAAADAADAYAYAAASKKERERQRQDIIAAFPPVALSQAEQQL